MGEFTGVKAFYDLKSPLPLFCLVTALIHYSFARCKNRELVFGCLGPYRNRLVKLKSVTYEVKTLKEDKTLSVICYPDLG